MKILFFALLQLLTFPLYSQLYNHKSLGIKGNVESITWLSKYSEEYTDTTIMFFNERGNMYLQRSQKGTLEMFYNEEGGLIKTKASFAGIVSETNLTLKGNIQHFEETYDKHIQHGYNILDSLGKITKKIYYKDNNPKKPFTIMKMVYDIYCNPTESIQYQEDGSPMVFPSTYKYIDFDKMGNYTKLIISEQIQATRIIKYR